MKKISFSKNNSRRAFLKSSAQITALAAAAPMTGFSPMDLLAGKKAAADMMHGIQIGAISFVDEGVDKVLEVAQQRAACNTIFLTTFTHGRGLAGRQIPGEKFPDHGSQVSDADNFHGGNYATPHPQYYSGTSIKVPRAPEIGNRDILAEVLPAAKKRGLKVFCSIEDQWRKDVPGIEDCFEIDLMGRKANTVCLYNPNIRNFWTSLVTDLCKSYDIDGILLFNERSGPLLNALGASHFQSIDSSRVTCFCEHHQRAAKERGISFERAKEGYLKLDQFIQASLKGQRPVDGYYVAFERLMMEYPEIAAWDRVFDAGKHEVLHEVYDTVKKINKNLQVGFHIEHVNSFNPIFRAARDYSQLAEKSDFLKVVAYNVCAGERYANFIRNIGSTVFRDVPLDELLRFNNHLLGYGEEAPLDKLPTEGLSADYVYRETKRAIDGVKGKCKILPGIDVNIPTKATSRKCSPEDVYAATLAGYKAGADGVILSRKYSEMTLAQVDAAGRAIRDGIKLTGK